MGDCLGWFSVPGPRRAGATFSLRNRLAGVHTRPEDSEMSSLASCCCSESSVEMSLALLPSYASVCGLLSCCPLPKVDLCIVHCRVFVLCRAAEFTSMVC